MCAHLFRSLWLLTLLVVGCDLSASVWPQGAIDDLPKYPVAALAAAVDLPTAELRAAAAVQLAKRSVPLDQWLDAARMLRPKRATGERVDDQTVRYRTRIHVMGAQRAAEILVRMPDRMVGIAGSEREGGPRPVLLCWHAAGQRGIDSLRLWSTLADRYGLMLVAPTETYELYRQEGWSYHPDGYIGVQEALRFVRRHHDVDEDRIFVAGVRGGGHMAWDVGLRFADQFAGIVAANGSPRLGQPLRDSNMAYLQSIAELPVRSLHWGEQEVAQSRSVDRAIEVLQSFGNRSAERLDCRGQLYALNPNLPGWGTFFTTRRSVPGRLVKFPDRAWTPHRADFGRHHWIDVLRYDRKARIPFPPKVPASKWRRLDEAEQFAYLDEYLRQRLPRIEATMPKPGLFVVETRHVESFRLLLSQDMIGDLRSVRIRMQGRIVRKTIEPSAEVFLREFVERFDRTFLPVAEVRVP